MAVIDDDVLPGYLQEIFSDRDGIKRFLEAMLNSAMKAEICEHIKAAKYERSISRDGHRNGYKGRKLSTRVGRLELCVPQARSCSSYHPSMFERFERS
jgi:transposase-like protein